MDCRCWTKRRSRVSFFFCCYSFYPRVKYYGEGAASRIKKRLILRRIPIDVRLTAINFVITRASSNSGIPNGRDFFLFSFSLFFFRHAENERHLRRARREGVRLNLTILRSSASLRVVNREIRRGIRTFLQFAGEVITAGISWHNWKERRRNKKVETRKSLKVPLRERDVPMKFPNRARSMVSISFTSYTDKPYRRF